VVPRVAQDHERQAHVIASFAAHPVCAVLATVEGRPPAVVQTLALERDRLVSQFEYARAEFLGYHGEDSDLTVIAEDESEAELHVAHLDERSVELPSDCAAETWFEVRWRLAGVALWQSLCRCGSDRAAVEHPAEGCECDCYQPLDEVDLAAPLTGRNPALYH
jgi:hypothetical protein